MKKQLCLILSVIMALTALAPCQSVIAAEVNKHSVGYFSDSVNELIDTYDSDEEYVSESESSQKTIKDRLIVSSDKVTNDYGAADKVVGLGYTILQYDSEETAETAKDSLIANGLMPNMILLFQVLMSIQQKVHRQLGAMTELNQRKP